MKVSLMVLNREGTVVSMSEHASEDAAVAFWSLHFGPWADRCGHTATLTGNYGRFRRTL